MAVGEQNRRERNYQVHFYAAQHHLSGAMRPHYGLLFGGINESKVISELAIEAGFFFAMLLHGFYNNSVI